MILLVEDDPFTREALEEVLQMHGLQYKSTSNVNEAIFLLKQMKSVTLLTDMLLSNGETARPIIEYCKKRHPNCKIILLTALARHKAEQLAQELHVKHLILKPFELKDLERALKFV